MHHVWRLQCWQSTETILSSGAALSRLLWSPDASLRDQVRRARLRSTLGVDGRGYYATRVPAHGADYRTSPSISLWFGRLVAKALCGVWEELGRPDPFWVIGVGAGLGDLAAGAMEAAGPLAGALRWRFVEQFERVAAWQGRRLGHASGSPPASRW